MSVGGIDASELVADPDFTEPFVIRRQTASQVEGETVTTSQDIQVVGIVQPASPQDLQALPEGDRHKQIVVAWTLVEMKLTPGAPDVLVVNGEFFRLIKLEPRRGYWKAFAEGYQP